MSDSETKIPHFDKIEELNAWYSSQVSIFKASFADDSIVLSDTQLQHVKTTIKWHVDNCPSLTTTANQLLNDLDNDEIVKKIRIGIGSIEELLKNIDSDDNWQYIGVKEDVDRWYRPEENDSHTFRVKGDVESSLYNILAVLNQAHMYKNWFPLMTSSVLLERQSRLKRLGISSLKLPWPLAPRDITFIFYMNELIGKKRVVIIMRSIKENDSFYSSSPEPPKGTVRGYCHYGGFSLEPISSEKTIVRGILNIDPKMDLVPGWLTSFVTGQIVHKCIVSIRKISQLDKTENKEYLIDINEHAKEYEDIKKVANSCVLECEQTK